MFLLMLMLNILSAQEIKLEFNDWNYETKIGIDSLNIRNIGLGIDYTIINPTEFNLSKIIKEHNSEFEYKYDVKTTYKNNILKVSSNTEINQIKIIDHIGKRIFETNNNKKSIEINIDLYKNISIILITIDNHSVVQKIYAKENELFLSNYVLLKDKNEWILTPYKKNYRDTAYTFQNYQFKDTLDFHLMRKRYKVKIMFDLKKATYNTRDYLMDPATKEQFDTSYTKLVDVKGGFTINLFDEKSIKNSGFYEQCGYYTKEYFKSGFTIIYSTKSYEPTIYTINVQFENEKIKEIVYNEYFSYRSTAYASSCDIKNITLILTNPIELENNTFKLNSKSLSDFTYKDIEDYNGSYRYIDDITSKFKKNTEDDDEIILNFTITKLD